MTSSTNGTGVPLPVTALAPKAPLPEVASRTTALFARVWPALKLIELVLPGARSPGKSVTWPPPCGATTVTLTAIALAVAGIAHWPVATKTRVASDGCAGGPGRWSALQLGGSAGAPHAPPPLRVSTSRQSGSA